MARSLGLSGPLWAPAKRSCSRSRGASLLSPTGRTTPVLPSVPTRSLLVSIQIGVWDRLDPLIFSISRGGTPGFWSFFHWSNVHQPGHHRRINETRLPPPAPEGFGELPRLQTTCHVQDGSESPFGAKAGPNEPKRHLLLRGGWGKLHLAVAGRSTRKKIDPANGNWSSSLHRKPGSDSHFGCYQMQSLSGDQGRMVYVLAFSFLFIMAMVVKFYVLSICS